MAKFQALFMLNFAKNTSWPAEDNGKTFTIAVVGDNALAGELKTFAKKQKIGNRSIEVVESANVGGIPKADIIYLGESKRSLIGSLVSSQSGNKVLIVSGTSGHCASGAGIAFLPKDGNLKYEIHEGNINKRGLKVTPKLISLGVQVF